MKNSKFFAPKDLPHPKMEKFTLLKQHFEGSHHPRPPIVLVGDSPSGEKKEIYEFPDAREHINPRKFCGRVWPR